MLVLATFVRNEPDWVRSCLATEFIKLAPLMKHTWSSKIGIIKGSVHRRMGGLFVYGSSISFLIVLAVAVAKASSYKPLPWKQRRKHTAAPSSPQYRNYTLVNCFIINTNVYSGKTKKKKKRNLRYAVYLCQKIIFSITHLVLIFLANKQKSKQWIW